VAVTVGVTGGVTDWPAAGAAEEIPGSVDSADPAGPAAEVQPTTVSTAVSAATEARTLVAEASRWSGRCLADVI
jgi:hypothetical protein